MISYDVGITRRLISEFEKVREDIIKNYENKNMRASGRLPESLEVTSSKGGGVTLVGNSYVEQLEWGRKPSSSMPPLQDIYDWIISKRIMDVTEKEYKIRGLAYVIARKIQNKGYDREGYGGVGLVSEVLTDQRIKSIIDLVGKDLFPIFEAELLTFFKN